MSRFILTFKTPQGAKKFKAPKGTQIYKVVDIYLILKAPRKPEFKELVVKNPELIQLQEDETYNLQSFCPTSVQNQIDNSRWDMELPNIDLMNEELKKMGVDPTQDKIAVIDSGFDSGNKNLVQGEVKVSSYLPFAGEDKIGHGSKVADRIFTASPGSHIMMYNALPGGLAFSSDIMIAVYMACEEGNSIINMSLSSDKPVQ